MNLPIAFTQYTRRMLGDAEAERLFAALEAEQPVSIRFNPQKLQHIGSDGAFRDSALLGQRVPWCTEGYYLNQRLTFTFDPLFHAGCYYVQEAGSMFVEQVLRQHVGSSPLTALDLCAAPGGKSTLLRSLLPDGSLLVANEVMRNRSQILVENLTKWGHPDIVVTNNDPADFTPLTEVFDLILTDVPCSGEGMFRKDEVAIEEWSEENVETCWQRQRRILGDIWPCLKPGGLLIYSTCTYNTLENEENIRWIAEELGADILPIEVPDAWGITGNLLPEEEFPVYRFLPHKTQGEGFFLAVLRKKGKSQGTEPVLPSGKEKKSKQGKGRENRSGKGGAVFGKEQLAELKRWICSPETYEPVIEGNRICAFPTAYIPLLALLKSSLQVLQYGCPLAEIKGKDLIPHHALAVGNLLNKECFPQAEVDYKQAIAYLRKEAVCLDEAPRGFVLLTYKEMPLGFAKNIGNRANNLYPQEWRIRSSYLPEELRIL